MIHLILSTIRQFRRKVLKQNIPLQKNDYITLTVGVDAKKQICKIISIIPIANTTRFYCCVVCKNCRGWTLSNGDESDILWMIRYNIPRKYFRTKQQFWVVEFDSNYEK